MSQTIENIIKRAKEEHWPYPKTFQLMKDAGVTSYEVWLANFDNSYKGTFGEWKEAAPQGYAPLSISEIYCSDTIATSLRRHQQGETTYLEIMKELAAAGVSHYRVDMSKRTVTYFDRAERSHYSEVVPEIEK